MLPKVHHFLDIVDKYKEIMSDQEYLSLCQFVQTIYDEEKNARYHDITMARARTILPGKWRFYDSVGGKITATTTFNVWRIPEEDGGGGNDNSREDDFRRFRVQMEGENYSNTGTVIINHSYAMFVTDNEAIFLVANLQNVMELRIVWDIILWTIPRDFWKWRFRTQSRKGFVVWHYTNDW